MYDLQETEAFTAWIGGLHDVRARAVIAARLRRLAVSGHWGDAKAVGEGVVELRVFYGPGLRIYVVERDQRLVIILGGGDKGTQKRDIPRAQALARRLES